MKALVYTGPQQIVFQDSPDPIAGPDDVLINVGAVGICGSDMHAFLGHDERRPAPLILGHEAAGVVVGGPDGGMRVVVNPLVTCGVCRDCLSGRENLCAQREIISMPPRQGAFAEKIVVPRRNIIEVPDSLDLTYAALAEPLATSWHGVTLAARHAARPLSEARALVMGGGAVGLGAALALRAFGSTDVTIAETNALRRQTATDQGFDKVVDPAAENTLEAGFADVVIDAVGNKHTRAAAVRSARPGSVIVHIGLGDGVDGFDARRVTLQEISFVGAYTYTMIDFRATLAAMASGALGNLKWIEARSLSEGVEAFDDLLAGRTGAAKIVLHPAQV
ncbi:MAG: galactitol-1-phosphate 5-dehydrogenase [Nitrospinae bacterium CG11_big_fil_rev_8_21_14_0_20_56_8]|nr:MAG: galactitol-1-phosphate 5-dehydrogenase [Nitrospinae bacterium CG11_big_fil_rev_8_21_14_0_20_56_8]